MKWKIATRKDCWGHSGKKHLKKKPKNTWERIKEKEVRKSKKPKESSKWKDAERKDCWGHSGKPASYF